MGVVGLTTFIARNSENLLVDYRVQDTKLVIDGYSLLWGFRKNVASVDPMQHGGEYAQLRTRINKFFMRLRECECQPFVVFDGGSDLDGKKMKKKLKRLGESIRRANAVTAEGKTNNCPCLLDHLLMIQVLKEMKVDFALSQTEADREIAILANHWGCPVLGQDSDYFIMDIVGGYIPFDTLKWDKPRKSQNGFNTPGKLYKLDRFCNVFGIRKELIPLFGTLCCNDYVTLNQVQDFLKGHLYRSDHSVDNRRNEEVRDILQWVSERKNLEEGLEEVLGHLPAEEEGPVRTSIGVYDISKETTSLLSSFFEETENLNGDLEQSSLCRILGAPLWVAKAHQRGDVTSTCINIMGHRSCVTCVQVEDPSSPSAWLPSKRLFSILAGICLAEKTHEAGPENALCTVYIRKGDKVGEVEVSPTVTIDQYGQLPSLSEIPSLTKSRKQQLIMSIFAPNLNADTDVELGSFPAEFQLALLATVYWINATETRHSKHQLTSLFLGWVHLYTEEHVRSGRQSSAKIQAIEREAERTLREKTPDATVSQSFAEWQYALLYAVDVNKLLQCPLPDCPDVSLLFGGLLMHGLVNKLRLEFPRYTLDHVHKEANKFLSDCSAEVKKRFKSMYSFVMSNVERKVRAKLDMFEN